MDIYKSQCINTASNQNLMQLMNYNIVHSYIMYSTYRAAIKMLLG